LFCCNLQKNFFHIIIFRLRIAEKSITFEKTFYMNPDNAVDKFRDKFNCAQSVLSELGPESGLDLDVCLKITQAFGGGIVDSRKICGAVSGALMAIGLKYGMGQNDPYEKKHTTYDKAREFLEKFESEFGSTQCADLLGADFNTEEGKQYIKENDLHGKICEKLVKRAIVIASNI
jgi:C_GCAxxG_C_C family probable redox protein